jgi:hypothetical protein
MKKPGLFAQAGLLFARDRDPVERNYSSDSLGASHYCNLISRCAACFNLFAPVNVS